MDKKIGNRNAGFSPVSRKVEISIRLMAMLTILFLASALLQSCSSNLPVDSIPATQTDITGDPTNLPKNAEKCGGSPEQYVCTGLHDYTITLTNVPKDVTPYLLPISPDTESQLRNLPRDGVGCVVSIAGNLVFYDSGNKLYTSFSEPVTLKLQYTDHEQNFFTLFNNPKAVPALQQAGYDDQLIECMSNLQKNGIDHIELVPVYLYTPMIAAYSDIHIWKPFQNFSIDETGKIMKIEFLYWGDRQIGGGTRP